MEVSRDELFRDLTEVLSKATGRQIAIHKAQTAADHIAGLMLSVGGVHKGPSPLSKEDSQKSWHGLAFTVGDALATGPKLKVDEIVELMMVLSIGLSEMGYYVQKH